jgi:hypothetical protein
MLVFFALLKWVLVASLLFAGVASLALGLGVQIGSVKWQGVEATGVPVGIGVLAAAVALAHFWKIGRRVTQETVSPPNPLDPKERLRNRDARTSITTEVWMDRQP